MFRSLALPLLLLFLLSIPANYLQAQTDLYALDHIVEIEINFEDPHWHRKLTTYKENRRDKRTDATLIVDGLTYEGVGVRFKGNSSLFAVLKEGGEKLPFNIKIDHTDEELSLPGGYTRLKLSNVFRDPSYLREAMSYAIAQDYLAAPQANFARVTVNGEYMGLYNLTQSVDEDMLESFFGDREGVLFKCDPHWEGEEAIGCSKEKRASLQYLGEDAACYLDKYELKSDEGWQELISFTRELNESPQTIHRHLDVDAALWMLAYDNVLVNLDSYIGLLCHNYYMYQDTFGIWHPVVWDMNMSLGGFRLSGHGGQLSNDQLATLSLFLHLRGRNVDRPLIQQLLSQSLYRKMYVAHARTIYEDYLENGQYKELAEQIRTVIEPEIGQEPHALYPAETFDENFEKSVTLGDMEIIGITELLDARADYLREHPLIKAVPPRLGEPTVALTDDEASISVEVPPVSPEEPVAGVYIFYRSGPYQPWMHEAMSMTEETDRYSISLPIAEVADYYLVAEGRITADVQPRRSGRESYSIQEN